MTWEQILELILKLIKQFCPNSSRAEVAQQLQNPSPLNKLRFERAIRQDLGMGPLAWLRERQRIMEPIYGAQHMAGDDETLDLILDAPD